MYLNIFRYIQKIIILVILLLPLKAWPADVLYINNSSLIQIGDNNRSYKVKLACIEVDPSQEEMAKKWLVSKLPRKTKVNILPKGVEDGKLVANIIKLSSGENINLEMVSKQFGIDICT